MESGKNNKLTYVACEFDVDDQASLKYRVTWTNEILTFRDFLAGWLVFLGIEELLLNLFWLIDYYRQRSRIWHKLYCYCEGNGHVFVTNYFIEQRIVWILMDKFKSFKKETAEYGRILLFWTSLCRFLCLMSTARLLLKINLHGIFYETAVVTSIKSESLAFRNRRSHERFVFW